MAYEIKPMNVSGILDEAVQLFRNRFKTLLIISLVLYVPFDLWRGLVVASNLAKIGSYDPHMSPKEVWQWYLSRGRATSTLQHVVTWLNILIAAPLASAAFNHAVSTEYLNKPATAMESIWVGLKKMPAILFTNLIFFLILFGFCLAGGIAIGVFMAVGGPLVVIPILVLVALVVYGVMRFSLMHTAIVVENKSGLKALERSGELMAGHYSQSFVISMVFLVFRIIVAMFGLMDVLIPLTYLRVVIQSLVDGIIMCYFTCAFVIFYYSCRCQRDHFDLTTLANAVKTDPPPEPAAPPV